MIYLICFSISVILADFANKVTSRKKFFALSLFSILVPALLAGLRDYEVGIDTMNYFTLKRYWAGAVSADSLGSYMKYYMSIGYGEPLFALLCGFVGQVFGNYSVLLCVIHVIIISGVYIGAYRFRKIVNPAFVLLLFYLVFYNHSLNIMRQYMAMAIVFAALADVTEKKYLRYCIAVVFATMFHTSALLGLGAVVMHWYIHCDFKACVCRVKSAANKVWTHIFKGSNTKRRSRNKLFCKVGTFFKTCYCWIKIRIERIKPVILRRQVFLFAALLLLVLIFNPLCRLVIELGLLNKKYLWYLDVSRAQHSTLITLFLLLEMCALIFWYKYLRRRNRLFDFFFTNTGAYLILHQISMFLVYGKRVAAYFALANLVTIAMIPPIFKDRKRRVIVTIGILVVVLFYWFYSYILRNASETYPYSFVFM